MRTSAQMLLAAAALIGLPANGSCENPNGWASEGRAVLSASSAVWNQPTVTIFELKRSTWKRTDTLEVTDVQGDVAYYVETNHNVFDARTRQPIPLKGRLRERDGHMWVVLETHQSVAFWRFRAEAMARMQDNLGLTEMQAAWGNGRAAMASLSYNSEGRLVRSHALPEFDTDPAGLLEFVPFSYWGATATAEHSRARGLLEEQIDGSYRLQRKSDIGHDTTLFEVSKDDPSELMLRETVIECDDEAHHFRYLGLQRFEGLGLPTSVEIDRVTKGGTEIAEIRITGIQMKAIDEVEFAEVRNGLAAKIDP